MLKSLAFHFMLHWGLLVAFSFHVSLGKIRLKEQMEFDIKMKKCVLFKYFCLVSCKDMLVQ